MLVQLRIMASRYAREARFRTTTNDLDRSSVRQSLSVHDFVGGRFVSSAFGEKITPGSLQ
jgi:hypothetical protein